ncbi:MAG: hypothetical protein IKK11_08830 [Oscillospiraceae bacterium]|nr:hypothetical protein [Oscillospiraceae bacterium]
MKRNSSLKSIMLITSICVLLCSCNSSGTIEYYSQKENYISVTGTVSSIKYNEEATALYIDFSELSPILDDTCFKIVGENLEIVKANRIDDKLKIGEQITFVTAPKYFGDGYVMPIVAISISGENMLGFEEGYKNLIDWLSE